MRKIIKNKKGVWMPYLISAILLVIVLGLVLWFIFEEYFDQNEINWETCRQSVILRANSPEDTFVKLSPISLKSKWPLKCKMQVIEIDFKNKTKAEEIIADQMASCWYGFNKGQSLLFSYKNFESLSYCVPCARIHFKEEVKDYYYGENAISIYEAMNRQLGDTGATYWQYLRQAYYDHVSVEYPLLGTTEGQTMVTELGDYFDIQPESEPGVDFSLGGWIAQLQVPDYVIPHRGDLVIFFQQSVWPGGSYRSMMFHFQVKQHLEPDEKYPVPVGPDPFEVMRRDFISAGVHQLKFCENFDGLPA